MINFWEQLKQIGLDNSVSPLEKRYITLMNEITFLRSFFLVIIASIFTLYLPQSNVLVITILAASIVMMMPLMMNKRKMYLLGRVFFSLSALVSIATLSYLIGKGSNAHSLMLVVIIVTYFIFPPKQSKIMYFLLSLISLTYLAFELSGDLFLLSTEFSNDVLKELNLVFKLGTLLLVFIFSAYTYRVIIHSEKSLEKERHKSENLLLNILPEAIAVRLKNKETTIADRINSASILFSDIVGFTQLSAKLSAVELVQMLDEIIREFDHIAEKYGLEKIKTIGDAYMVAGGVPNQQVDHAERIALMALDMCKVMSRRFSKKYNGIEIRIGIHSGPIIAGVIGKNKYTYDLWGDTVNTASRMESHGLSGQIQLSSSTYELLKDKFTFTERGKIDIKGKGHMQTHILENIRT